MPRATAKEETHRKELESLPGGYIVARRLTYGEKQKRFQLAGDQSMMAGVRPVDGQGQKVDIRINTFAIQLFDFSHCIVEHNLTKDDEERIPFNFKNAADLDLLEDTVGQEIEEFLDTLNNEETEEERQSFRAAIEESRNSETADQGTGSG